MRLIPNITTRQRIEIFQRAHANDADRTDLYTLWNDCTYIATREKNAGSVHKMMSAINEVFAEGGIADSVLRAEELDCLILE